MIVDPNVRQHPKFIALKRLVGGEAMEYLVAIWGHCQQAMRGQFWPGADADYVEIVCTGRAGKRQICDALVATGWITLRDGGLEIHDWAEHNARLVARWKRPSKGHAHTPEQPGEQQPVQGSIQGSVQPSVQNTIRYDMIRSTGGNNKGAGAGAAVAASKVQFAALASQIAELERIADRSSEQRAELRQKRAALRELQQKQAAGNFDA